MLHKGSPNLMTQNAISLFSSAGIGDLAFQRLPVRVLVSCELLEDRHQVYQANFTETHALTGDIWELWPQVVRETQSRLSGRDLDILFATPPCQGMSKNGRGKLLQAVRNGSKPALDVRNRLIIPTLKIARALRPRLMVLENVPEMENTLIQSEDGRLVSILDLIREELGDEYGGEARVVEFADHGVPQRRQRLITVFTRDAAMLALLKERRLFPRPRYAPQGREGRLPWVTVRDVISDMPPLDASTRATSRGEDAFHFVPLLDEDKYFWVRHTPPEKGAFDNQCVACGHDKNPVHGNYRDEGGINRSSRETPLHCVKCGALLPRPWVRDRDTGMHRLMRGYTSAYKRMSWDLPASALTTNLAYACSDNKLHPEQHRVLSLREALMLHTITDYDYKFERVDGNKVTTGLIYEIIGESIPPRGLEVFFKEWTGVLGGKADNTIMNNDWAAADLPLFHNSMARLAKSA
jgi:DNA (cytosine-5)-methyltransferase 1